MTSYILKNNKNSKDILLFEEKEAYSFTPKKTYKWVKKVTVLDTEMLSNVWKNKTVTFFTHLYVFFGVNEYVFVFKFLFYNLLDLKQQIPLVYLASCFLGA